MQSNKTRISTSTNKSAIEIELKEKFHIGFSLYILKLILDYPLIQTLPAIWPNGSFKISFPTTDVPIGWDKSSWAWENRGSI